MYPNKDPSELLPTEHDLEDVNDDSSPSNPFYKGCLIAIAILVILSLVIRLYL
jgi:hypothetical protein